MAEPTKTEPKKAKKPEDPRIIAAQERLASLNKGPGGAPKSPIQSLKEVWRELKLTTWPDQITLRKSTGVVLAFIVATAAFTGGLDYVIGKLTEHITK